jgi:hypothetical protein
MPDTILRKQRKPPRKPMKTDRYELLPNPHGGWLVKEIGKEGMLRTFSSKEDAIAYLKTIATSEPHGASVELDISQGIERTQDERA